MKTNNNELQGSGFKSNLFRAALSDDVGELEAALSQGADINEVDPETRMTPLHVAAQAGSINFIERAVQEPSLAKRAYDASGYLPFQYSADRGDEDAKRVLHTHMFGATSTPEYLH